MPICCARRSTAGLARTPLRAGIRVC